MSGIGHRFYDKNTRWFTRNFLVFLQAREFFMMPLRLGRARRGLPNLSKKK